MATGDDRFFGRSGPHSLAAIASAAQGSAPTSDVMFVGIGPLQTAGPLEVSFLDNRRYGMALQETRAGAVIVHPDMAMRVPAGTIAITTPRPYEAWARVAALFHPLPPAMPGIHPTAIVDPAAEVHGEAQVGPYCVIAAGATVGARSVLSAFVHVGKGVSIGADCRIGAHASLSHAILGDRVMVYVGVRIGQEGFGFAATKSGTLSVPQLGRVLIGDDVEIGANTTIDRGSAADTVIGSGTRIDNLVQLAHNVRVGRCCIIVAQAGIAGSTVIGDFVQIGGQAAIGGHLTVGAGAKIGAQAGVISDVAPGEFLVGSPAQPRREFFRQVAILKRLMSRRLGRKRASPPSGSSTD